MEFLPKDDPELAGLIKNEEFRIENTIDLIAAENHSPRSINEALGSVFNTKTIEGYPGKRFHAGCVYADEVENLAITRGKQLFGAEHINVQPHSGTSANLAVYFSVLEVGDRILAMRLPHGGHLSHGHRASITSKCFEFNHYGVDYDTELIDYDKVRERAHEFKPKMIVVGASSYPRIIDYEKMAEIAKEMSAYLFADMAHLAGLVAANVIPSPLPSCDFVTLTCYKTMMGGRGGVILCRRQHGKKVDRAVFPGCQGTSAVNSIAAKALIFKLAMTPEFAAIQKKTLENAKRLAKELDSKGYRIVTGGTENHQVLVDVSSKGLDGNAAEKILEAVGILTNRNVIPADANSPGKVSGLRLGSSAVSTRGMAKPEIVKIADLIDMALLGCDDKGLLDRVLQTVIALCKKFQVYNSG
ncbi:MAG: serine hydroxymethyltransferase [Deltaproteobacteria bacterium]|nr:MAG: serine hydroxymethyltransferase [Deltaproteobacteria bacterium]